MSAAVRRVAGDVASNAFRPRRAQSPYIKLDGLPSTATPGDVNRMIRQYNVQNVVDIALNYKRFSPNGSAFLTVAQAGMVPAALDALENATLFGHPVSSLWVIDKPRGPPSRSRGAAGRAEAAQRAIVTGDGLHGGLHSPDKCVVIWGLPGRILPDGVRQWLRGYKLGGGEGEIVKLDPPGNGVNATTARVLVRLASTSEAYRLVRDIHKTWYQRDVWGEDYVVHARTIY